MFATVTVNYIHSELPQNGKCCVYMHAPTRSGKILLLFASFCPQSAYQSSSLLRCICAYINLTSTTFTFSNVCFVLFGVLEGNYPNAPYDVHVTCKRVTISNCTKSISGCYRLGGFFYCGTFPFFKSTRSALFIADMCDMCGMCECHQYAPQ